MQTFIPLSLCKHHGNYKAKLYISNKSERGQNQSIQLWRLISSQWKDAGEEKKKGKQ